MSKSRIDDNADKCFPNAFTYGAFVMKNTFSLLMLLLLFVGCDRPKPTNAVTDRSSSPNRGETEPSDRTATDKETTPESKYGVLISGNLDDLSADALAIVRQLPGVLSVSRDGPADSPEYRIIHLLDWHYVSKDDYAADLQSVFSKPLSDGEFDQRYDNFLNEV